MLLRHIVVEVLWSNDGNILLVWHLVVIVVRLHEHVRAGKLGTRAQVRQTEV